MKLYINNNIHLYFSYKKLKHFKKFIFKKYILKLKNKIIIKIEN